ncbi:MAG: VWA domain-containing protein [Sandaracinaceae bacterium]|nr:VWA domain-containing protein [Sandaracinaceae bacterium]
MSWREPSWWWWVLGVGLVLLSGGLALVSYWLRQRGRARFGPATSVLVAGRSGAWRAVRAVLVVLSLALIVAALAGPQYGSRTRVLRKRGVDLVIALDFSKSMLARDVRPSRIERAKAEIVRLLGELEGDRVGIVAFAGETMEFPMTTDYSALQLFFRDLGPYDMPVGGTAIGRALVASRRLLERSDTRRPDQRESEPRSMVVVLMTDGEDHEGDPVAAARELASAGVKVHTVGIGSATGEPIPQLLPDGTEAGYVRDQNGNVVMTALTAENERQLREIAQVTGGRYFRAGRGQVGVDQIRRELRSMHQQERETQRVTVDEPRFALVLLPAFLFLLIEALLPDAWIGRRKRRPPPPPARRARASAKEEEA